MTPPDSGEREVCDVVFDGMSGKRYSCNLELGHVGPHVRVDPLGQRVALGVTISPDLAQRILAALEEAYGFVPMAGKELQNLADELRAVMPKGTR